MRALTEATRKLFAPIDVGENDRLQVDAGSRGDRGSFVLSIYGIFPPDPSKRTLATWRARKEFIERFPERRVISDSVVEVPQTDYSAHIIEEVWPIRQRLVIDGAQDALSDILQCTKNHDHIAEAYGEFKAAGIVPPHNIEVCKEFPLSKYQEVACYCSMATDGYALYMEQGTGKTPIVIARICNESKVLYNRQYRVLIVCPKNVRSNWEREFHKFATQPGRVFVVRGDQYERVNMLVDASRFDERSKFTAIIIGYETLWGSWEAFSRMQFDLSVLDESHFIKSPKAKRTKAAIKLRDISKNRMVLTGTPIANHPIDLYSPFEFLGEGVSGFSSFKSFKKFYGRVIPGDNPAIERLETEIDNKPMLKERLARHAFIIRKSETDLDLPEKVYGFREVDLTEEQAEAYITLSNELIVRFKDDLDGDGEPDSFAVNCILTQMLRLAQITSGFLVRQEECTDEGVVITPRMEIPFSVNPKLKELGVMMRELPPDEKAIVWCSWIFDIKSIEAHLTSLGIDCVTYYGDTTDDAREEAERRFNNDRNCRVFIGNPAAGGSGINLLGYDTRNPGEYDTDATLVVYYSHDWSSIKRSQSEDRAHRRGTRRRVQVIDLCVPGTIDFDIRTRVIEKRTLALEIADVKDMLLKGLIYHE